MKFNEFNIQFSSLKPGLHEYNFLVEHTFFELFQYSPVNEGRIWVKVELNKHETMLVLNFRIHGTIRLNCARCNEMFDMPIEGIHKLVVKFGTENIEESDDIMVIPFGEHQINIAQHIYEFIVLCIPLQSIHPDDEHGNSTCDPKALELINRLSINHSEVVTDPRWDALKQLKQKK